MSYVHVPDNQRRKLDAKAHRAILVGYPPGVKFIKPDMNQEYESVPVPFLPEAHQVKDNVKPPVQEHVEPAPVKGV